MKRLYVQYEPDGASRSQLIVLQSKLQRLNKQARMVSPEQIHLTIIHFGKIDDVFETLVLHNHALQRSVYQAELSALITACAGVLPERIDVTVTRYALYGEHGHTLVLEASADANVYEAHAGCFESLQRLFRGCGIQDVDDFMAQDHNFKHARSLHPHITLLKGADVLPNEPVMKETLHLQLMPIRYD